MNEKKKIRLEVAGWTVGDAEDFLGLTDEERELLQRRFAESRAAAPGSQDAKDNPGEVPPLPD